MLGALLVVKWYYIYNGLKAQMKAISYTLNNCIKMKHGQNYENYENGPVLSDQSVVICKFGLGKCSLFLPNDGKNLLIKPSK